MFPVTSVGMSFFRQPETHFKTQIQLDSEIAKSSTNLYKHTDSSHHFEVLMTTVMYNLVISFKATTL